MMNLHKRIRKRRSTRGQEVSPGGSTIYRYDHPNSPRYGYADAPTDLYRMRRETVYRSLFGSCETVRHEMIPLIPHIDIYIYAPEAGRRDFYTLITGGMSDLPMNVPDDVADCYRRAELILYVRQPTEAHISLLRFLAHFPHDQRTWIGHGHTIPNGQPPVPLFEGSKLDTMLLCNSILSPDNSLPRLLTLDDCPVQLLWLIPITTAECNFKLRYGIDRLLEVFDRVDHPFLLEEKRRSYL
jgi:hypothetical protein